MSESYTTDDKRRALVREIHFRKLVYPPRVKAGHMSPQEAQWQIGVMEAIVEDYDKLSEKERLL